MKEVIGKSFVESDYNPRIQRPLLVWLYDYFGWDEDTNSPKRNLPTNRRPVPTESNKVSQAQMVREFQSRSDLRKFKKKDLEACLSHVRVNGLIPISGIGKMFLMTENRHLDQYQQSLLGRNEHNSNIVRGLETYRNRMFAPQTELENEL